MVLAVEAPAEGKHFDTNKSREVSRSGFLLRRRRTDDFVMVHIQFGGCWAPFLRASVQLGSKRKDSMLLG